MPLISVIIAVYNAESYISKCIDSILAQSFADYELILVDDGSSDKSAQICDKYSLVNSHIRTFHKKNGGVSSARNMGISKSTGEWLYFIDADDVLLPNALSILSSKLSDSIGLVMAGYKILSDDDNLIFEQGYIYEKNISRHEALLEMYSASDFPYQGYLWCKLFSSELIRNYNLRFNEDIFFNEDRLFVVQFLCKSSKPILYTTVPVYCYYKRKNGAMSSLNAEYNPKFVTDFDAYVLMKKEIVATSKDGQLQKSALNGICDSFLTNINLMVKYKKYNFALHRHMLKHMILTGAIKSYICAHLRPFILLFIPFVYSKK